MIHMIPPSTKNRSHIFRNFDWVDILILALGVGFAALFIMLQMNTLAKFLCVASVLIFTSLMITKFSNLKGYQFFWYFLTFNTRKKKMQNVRLKQDCEVTFDNNTVVNPTIKSKIIEIHGIDFLILPGRKQDQIINSLANLYKNIRYGKIVKLDKPCDFSHFIEDNERKLAKWKEEANKALNDYEANDEIMSDNEAFGYASRIEVLENYQNNFLEYHQNLDHIMLQTFYLVMYDINEDDLNFVARQSLDYLSQAQIDAHILDNNEVKEFYELFYDKKLDENKDFELPEVIEHFNKLTIDGENYKISTIERLPLTAANAWMANIFRLKGTKCVLNFNIDNNKQKQYKAIDRSVRELRTRYFEKNIREDEKVELDTEIAGLEELVDQLKMDGEALHTCSFYFLYPEEQFKDVEQVFKDSSIYTDVLPFRQFSAYLAMQPYAYEIDYVKAAQRQYQTTTLSATFPFVTKTFMDPEGMFLGSDSDYVFFDQFYSWKYKGRKRTSANMAVLGKTGGGKSYFMKKLIMQHLCNGVKVFVLDPENEYEWLSRCFGGNIIDVGGVGSGIINPLQVFPTLKGDTKDGEEQAVGEVSSHRQFLQEFFGIICPRLENRCFVFLDEAIGELFARFNITDDTDVESLSPEDFPTLEDLYNIVDEFTQKELSNPNSLQYHKESLVILRDNLKAFKKGGVHSKLWNGHTSLVLNNDFTVLNFQSLFSANNKTVANAQMLLVMRYLMQEIIKNKNNNELYHMDKNVVVAVDEAHQFIDPKFPVALDFMSQMVKRIRKYGGAMVITTQNIADFIGQSEETKAKATAVINGCQYTMVFGLNPNDVNNMIELYSKYNGGLTQNEIDILVDARQGEALFLVDSNTRMSVHIQVVDGEQDYMMKPEGFEEEQEEDEDAS